MVFRVSPVLIYSNMECSLLLYPLFFTKLVVKVTSLTEVSLSVLESSHFIFMTIFNNRWQRLPHTIPARPAIWRPKDLSFPSSLYLLRSTVYYGSRDFSTTVHITVPYKYMPKVMHLVFIDNFLRAHQLKFLVVENQLFFKITSLQETTYKKLVAPLLTDLILQILMSTVSIQK